MPVLALVCVPASSDLQYGAEIDPLNTATETSAAAPAPSRAIVVAEPLPLSTELESPPSPLVPAASTSRLRHPGGPLMLLGDVAKGPRCRDGVWLGGM